MKAIDSGSLESPRPIELVLPATSANLGPAFDTAAIALRLHLRLRASVAASLRVHASGRDSHICGAMENNLLLETYRGIFAELNRPAPPIQIEMENEIPIGKGLGSSAAARLAATVLAAHFGDLPWSDLEILHEASRRENHADNVAACWLGGFVIVQTNAAAASNLHPVQLDAADWPLLVAVADGSLATEQSRAVIPEHYSRADAVTNIQNAMLLATALVQGRTDLLQAALRDRMHEPYRSPLCPLLQPLRELAGSDGILGVVLSGAGPSVLMWLDPVHDVQAIRERVGSALAAQGMNAELILTKIEPMGAAQSRRVSVPITSILSEG